MATYSHIKKIKLKDTAYIVGTNPHTHSVSTATVAGSNHTHSASYSGTTAATVDASKVTVLTGVKPTGSVTVLTGVKASTSDTFVKSISGGSGSLDFYSSSTTTTASGKTNDRIPFVTAQGTFTAGTTPPKSATLSSSNADTETNNGAAVTALTEVKVGDTVDVVDATVNGTVLELTTKTAAKSVIVTGTAPVAPSGHTHTYTKATSVTLNVGTPPSLSSATINYLGHTHTTADVATTGEAVTAVAGSGTASVITGVTANGTASVATGTHTHDYSGSITSGSPSTTTSVISNVLSTLTDDDSSFE